MHVTERDSLILSLLSDKGFVSFRELEKKVDASPATIRRDLERLGEAGQLIRVRGGAKSSSDNSDGNETADKHKLFGAPFEENITRKIDEKRAIGKRAAELCEPGEGVTIDGGTTTLQMCSHLSGLGLQVLSNSLHIVLALMEQSDTRILMPGGALFREQNIILPLFGEDLTPRFHAPKLFMGAGAIGPQGVMQEDVVLVAGERRFIERAEKVIVLADSTKFASPSGNVVCPLNEVTTIVTDSNVPDSAAQFVEKSGVELIIVEA